MNSIVYYFLHRPHFESVNAMQQKMVTDAHLQYASLWLVTYGCKMYSAVVGLIDSDNTFFHRVTETLEQSESGSHR